MISENLIKILDNSISQNKISHCYLLSSSSNIDINESLIYFINRVNNSQITSLNEQELPANVMFFNEDLSKSKIVSVMENSTLASFVQNAYKIIILKEIDKASNASLNALLKNIEEPSSDTIFLLTTRNINSVLPTIQSRSIVINIKAPSYLDIEAELINKNYPKEQAWFFSYVFNDLSQSEKYLNNDSYELVLNLLEAVNKSFKEKYHLYVFLTKFSKKENKNTMAFLVLCLKFIFSWIWNKFSLKNPLMKKVASKLKEAKIDYFALFTTIDEYLESLESNENYFLQTERMLTKIVGAYE
ncbi:DNA polymerase III subunit tau [Mycoplasmopsis agalactiae]|uniref:DNA polymerase III subunit n=1 Tax=Mycoplasmopsis agalactiae (strain NCTC 10123 / CIP 59.7 / PG2) TaxID=347257 RepID=A5IZC5_MYCAP|nr:DNA polymerase III subunit delta' [Mycoplasmopsis agalactiae]MCE6057400.1 DNA polymerase III subunit delta' [Mycoplasmopsis agalactiae]MCE6079178.1 DNA polymerase III subunit delta' [Mycoplasmopsis agalactiae]MCE6095576.1 DNA polymerase III subunit delta' [Mycoplasmopsis agalactiae]MCE6114823.1 DNA polymerase III subunit delta' [Mycoplasmopsis agalactiae]NLS34444.1 DNA polymerase III subunit delta' [Mycoplasmopsis agalactiae]